MQHCSLTVSHLLNRRFQFEDDEWDVAFSPPPSFPTRGSDLRSQDRVTLVDATAGTHTFTDTRLSCGSKGFYWMPLEWIYN